MSLEDTVSVLKTSNRKETRRIFQTNTVIIINEAKITEWGFLLGEVYQPELSWCLVLPVIQKNTPKPGENGEIERISNSFYAMGLKISQ